MVDRLLEEEKNRLAGEGVFAGKVDMPGAGLRVSDVRVGVFYFNFLFSGF